MQYATFYTLIIIPLLIFVARIADVSIGTVRIIFISKGKKYLASILGFFEVIIWLLAIGQIMKNLTNPVCYIAYGGGFAMGNYIGILIAEKLSLGVVMLRVVTQANADNLLEALRASEFGVTSLDGQGKYGTVKIIFTITPRRQVNKAILIVKQQNPQAFYTIEEVGDFDMGSFPPKNPVPLLDFLSRTKPARTLLKSK